MPSQLTMNQRASCDLIWGTNAHSPFQGALFDRNQCLLHHYTRVNHFSKEYQRWQRDPEQLFHADQAGCTQRIRETRDLNRIWRGLNFDLVQAVTSQIEKGPSETRELHPQTSKVQWSQWSTLVKICVAYSPKLWRIWESMVRTIFLPSYLARITRASCDLRFIYMSNNTIVTKSLQAAKASTKSKVDGRPLNFGTVLSGAIYRSSFPQIEDFQFLGTLGLKTIVYVAPSSFKPCY